MPALRALIEGVEHRLLRGSLEAEIRAVEHDSRRVSPGACFFWRPTAWAREVSAPGPTPMSASMTAASSPAR